MHNTVVGNFISTDVSGTAPISNGNSGIGIGYGASYNRVGSDAPGERNLIRCSEDIPSTGLEANALIARVGRNERVNYTIRRMCGIILPRLWTGRAGMTGVRQAARTRWTKRA